jgi:hypothetical protein
MADARSTQHKNPQCSPSAESTAEPHLSLTIGDGEPSGYAKKKNRIIGFFFENKLHWQFSVQLLLFTICTFV